MTVKEVINTVEFPVEAKIYWLFGQHLTFRDVKDWTEIYNVFGINEEKNLMWDFDPQEKTKFIKRNKILVSSLVVGTVEDIYDYKNNVKKFNTFTTRFYNPILYSGFVMLRTEKINLKIGRLKRK